MGPLHGQWSIHLCNGCAGPLGAQDPGGIGTTSSVQHRRLAIPVSLPPPPDPNQEPMGLALATSLTTAVEEAVPVAADAVCHLVGKGGGTTRLIEDITSIIVGVGDRGDGNNVHCTIWTKIGPPPPNGAARLGFGQSGRRPNTQ